MVELRFAPARWPGVDVHVVTFDGQGNGLYGPQDESGGDFYPASAFSDAGAILGKKVRCLSPEYQVISHTGYEIDANDVKDVLALYEAFGVALPAEYRGYLSGDSE